MNRNFAAILTITLAFALLAATPAAAQTRVLNIEQLEVPLAVTLDNPCTAGIEAIAFTGKTLLNQEVWLMPEGRTRLVISESTTLQGTNTAVLFGTPSPTYLASSSNDTDVEFYPGAASLYNYKKVNNSATPDNFYTILNLDFDPNSLRLNLSVSAACDDGSPTP